MATLLKGPEVTAALNAKLVKQTAELKTAGVYPTMAMVRVGEREEDISYERGAVKRCQHIGAAIRQYVLPLEATQESILAVIQNLNADPTVHGVLIFRPLPPHMDDAVVRNALHPAKDLDGISNAALSYVFSGLSTGFPPCTAQACLEIIDYYGIGLKGRKVAVIGRSLVVGKPVSMMLLDRDATVTICHRNTANLPEICRAADVLIVAAGQAGIVDKSFLASGQTVIDVGIHPDASGKISGDVVFDQAESVVGAITPVPGGVGAVTTTVLIKHLVEAARRNSKQ
jgi:methylenetetrahydrofolate dehydrogenase (NADP+)/methenyltetrahydrofolate cyclohydrolase